MSDTANQSSSVELNTESLRIFIAAVKNGTAAKSVYEELNKSTDYVPTFTYDQGLEIFKIVSQYDKRAGITLNNIYDVAKTPEKLAPRMKEYANKALNVLGIIPKDSGKNSNIKDILSQPHPLMNTFISFIVKGIAKKEIARQFKKTLNLSDIDFEAVYNFINNQEPDNFSWDHTSLVREYNIQQIRQTTVKAEEYKRRETPMTPQDWRDLGINVSNLHGTLVRDKEGKKITPAVKKPKNSEKKWFEHVDQPLNSEQAIIGETGVRSNLCVVDADSQEHWDMICKLDPFNPWKIKSVDKPGGHIYYKRDLEFPETKIENQLDLLASEGSGVYLPCKGNKLKQEMYPPIDESGKVIDFPEMPESLKEHLRKLGYAKKKEYDTSFKGLNDQYTKYSLATANCEYLYNEVKAAIETHHFSDKLLRSLTPRKAQFTTSEAYKRDGYVHPRDIPEGLGNLAAIHVTTKLGLDLSIDAPEYREVLLLWNSLMREPMPKKEIERRVVYHTSGEAKKDGISLWGYDPNWKDKGPHTYTFKGLGKVDLASSITLGKHYLVSRHDGGRTSTGLDLPKVTTFNTGGKLWEYAQGHCTDLVKLVPDGKGKLSEKEMTFRDFIKTCKEVHEVMAPNKPPGFFDDQGLNLYSGTGYTSIFQDPETATHKEYPKLMMAYLKHLVPCDITREYLLSFLARRLTTFEFSPVVFFFEGVSGAGKTHFRNLLSKIVGEAFVGDANVDLFTDRFRSWLLNRLFIAIEEGDESDSSYSAKKLRSHYLEITGKRTITINRKNQDPIDITHNATLMFASNYRFFTPPPGDRRALIIVSPNKVEGASWLKDFPEHGADMAPVMKATLEEAEINRFCYFLATKQRKLSDTEYETPPRTQDKIDYLEIKVTPENKIFELLTGPDFSKLDELDTQYGLNIFYRADEDSRVYFRKIYDLYEAVIQESDYKSSIAIKDLKKKFTKHVRFKASSSSTNKEALREEPKNKNVSRYFIPGLETWLRKKKEAEVGSLAPLDRERYEIIDRMKKDQKRLEFLENKKAKLEGRNIDESTEKDSKDPNEAQQLIVN